ncbi:MAG: low-specificity L-threonine aldolase [Myxococcales bacterium]|nr:low-specificity L-threonine aldolase [Myxococcales bacterium]
MTIVDLRSDTVTKPTAAMRAAMASAEVGDDVYGEDPTVRRLEEQVAGLLGKERGLFVPSGTMGNQLAILVHCKKGDEVVVGEGSHSVWYESGGGAALAGVQFAIAGQGGLFDEAALLAAIKPSDYYYPRTSLVALEDTHNRAGGRVWPRGQVERVLAAARARGLATHLDGARLWNACVASERTPAERAAGFDSVTVCLSKGLGAPVGSVLCGSADFVKAAHRYRKMLGAGMRQVGVLAAAGLHALEHHRARLADDHAHARALAEQLVAGGLRVDLATVETNIVQIDLDVDADPVLARARAAGVLVGASGPRRLRAVTHLDVDAAAVRLGAERLLSAVAG